MGEARPAYAMPEPTRYSVAPDDGQGSPSRMPVRRSSSSVFSGSEETMAVPRSSSSSPGSNPRALAGDRGADEERAAPSEAVPRTVMSIEYPMHVVSLSRLLQLYGGEGRRRALDPHQWLKAQGHAVPWTPSLGGEVIFVSHEWTGWNHPDPTGTHTETLCAILDRLRRGDVGQVELHWMSQLVLGGRRVVKAAEWRKRLEHAWVWLDFISVPQHGRAADGQTLHERAAPPGPDAAPKFDNPKSARATNSRAATKYAPNHSLWTDDVAALRRSMVAAIDSVPGYIELSTLVLVLVPGTYHADRVTPRPDGTTGPAETNYRTWRARGWCRAELMCASLAPGGAKDVLLVRSKDASPIFLDASATNVSLSPCMGDYSNEADRGRIARVLDRLIDAKLDEELEAGRVAEYRRLQCMRSWYTRASSEGGRGAPPRSAGDDEGDDGGGDGEGGGGDGGATQCGALSRLKQRLRWTERDDAARAGWSLLAWAVLADDEAATRALLALPSARREVDRPQPGRPEWFVQPGMTSLHLAMAYACPAIVAALLDRGADSRAVSANGCSPLFGAACFGRTENVLLWYARFPGYKIRREYDIGAVPLDGAFDFGPNKLATARVLIAHGADVADVADLGCTPLMFAAGNEDASPEWIRFVCGELRRKALRAHAGAPRARGGSEAHAPLRAYLELVNAQQRGRRGKWRVLPHLMRFARRRLGVRSVIVEHMVTSQGMTALHMAARRGDAIVVRALLDAGADPTIRTDAGLDALAVSRAHGPYPAVEEVLAHHRHNDWARPLPTAFLADDDGALESARTGDSRSSYVASVASADDAGESGHAAGSTDRASERRNGAAPKLSRVAIEEMRSVDDGGGDAAAPGGFFHAGSNRDTFGRPVAPGTVPVVADADGLAGSDARPLDLTLAAAGGAAAAGDADAAGPKLHRYKVDLGHDEGVVVGLPAGRTVRELRQCAEERAHSRKAKSAAGTATRGAVVALRRLVELQLDGCALDDNDVAADVIMANDKIACVWGDV